MTQIDMFDGMEVTGKSAVVVLSGGQDSVTCLGWALKHFEQVFAIGFRYGQKHEIELEQAAKICKTYDVSFQTFDIPVLAELGDSALTTNGDVTKAHHRMKNLPASFVPNRNALFLTMAHAYAQKVESDALVTGVCQTDYSGYPDCRDEAIGEIEKALNVAYETSIRILTPLMWLNKAETFKLAEEVGFLSVVIDESHTCYNGERNITHSWGKGCGQCPACELRSKGYELYISNSI